MSRPLAALTLAAACLLSTSALADVPSDDGEDDGSCECQAAGLPTQGGELALGLLLAGVVIGRERRRRR